MKKRVTERESNREELSPAESSSGRRSWRSAFRSGRVSASAGSLVRRQSLACVRERETRCATLVKVEWNRVYRTSSLDEVLFSRKQREHASKLRELAHMQLRSHANAPATVHKVRWTLDMHRPKRSEDGEATELRASAKRVAYEKR